MIRGRSSRNGGDVDVVISIDGSALVNTAAGIVVEEEAVVTVADDDDEDEAEPVVASDDGFDDVDDELMVGIIVRVVYDYFMLTVFCLNLFR